MPLGLDHLQRPVKVSWRTGDLVAVLSVRSFAAIFAPSDLSNLFVKLQVLGDLHLTDRRFLQTHPEWVGSVPGEVRTSDPEHDPDEEYPSLIIVRNLPLPAPPGPLALYNLFSVKHYYNIDPGENEAVGYILINLSKIKSVAANATEATLLLDPRPTHFPDSSWGDLEFAITVVKLPEDPVEPIQFEQVRAGGDVELFLSNVNGTRLYPFPGWKDAHPTTHFSYKGVYPNSITRNGVTMIHSIKFNLNTGFFSFL